MKKITMVLLLAFSFGIASDGEALFKKCTSCHGLKAEKKALGKSAVIQDWEIAKIKEALTGYKDGSYGGAMKAVMKGQVASLSTEDIDTLATYVNSLK